MQTKLHSSSTRECQRRQEVIEVVLSASMRGHITPVAEDRAQGTYYLNR